MAEINSNQTSPSTSPKGRSSLPTKAPSTTLTTSPTRQNKTQATMAASTPDSREASSTAVARSHMAPSIDTHMTDDDSASATSTKLHRKRAYSIDVEEANQPRIQDLRLYTPTTANSNTSEGPRELICLCTKAPKVPRPRNAFILYRQHYQGQVAARHPGLANPEISKLIGEQWREQPEEIKNNWKRLAEEEKIRHQRQYPDYRYQPRRGGKAAGSRPLPATGEDPGHCPKCGGRYIATPRTPSTPFSAATPELSRPGPNMPPYVTPNPRVIETDHLRRGSSSSTMSLDAHDRRYTQPHLHNIDEDYPMMSPVAETKRRRFNGPNILVPRSPPMGYMPADPRYQRPSFSQPPVTAAGYAPGGSLPRMQYQQHGYPNQSHMQPPPRPSVVYQPVSTSSRHNAGFVDESLRLPPLQTQLPNSPAMSSESGSGRVVSAAQPSHGTGLGIVDGAGAPARQSQPQLQQQQQHGPSKWSFLLKLDVLRVVSPPLQPPPSGEPMFETRGPLIAIEGATPSVLKEVASVVEKSLSISGDYAVKTWTEENQGSIRETSDRDSSDEQHEQEPIEKGLSKRTGHISPLATYVTQMLKWHKTSEDLIKYITNNPPATGSETGESARAAEEAPLKSSPRLPVAIVADGYSMTVSERYASSLHVNDAYRAEDHWQWVATLWRGIIGPDLTIYVKKGTDAELQGNNCVEFVNSAVMVLRVAEGKGVDEKLERRLGFEIIEWVRNGSFRAGHMTRS